MTSKGAESNPFRVEKFESLQWLAVPDRLETLFQNWREAGFRGQLVGDHGAGKTTLGLQLQRYAEDKGKDSLYLFANTDSFKKDFSQWRQKLKGLPPETLVILDGIGHAPYFLRRSLLKKTPHFLALVHEPLQGIKTLCHLKPQAALFLKLSYELAGDEGHRLIAQAGGADQILSRHQGNLRQCFFELYDLWSD